VKKNLVFIIGSLQVGGTERHLAYILPRLKEKGWVVRVITLSEKGALAPILEDRGIPVSCVAKAWHLKIFCYFPRFLGRLFKIIVSTVGLAWQLKSEKNTVLHFFLPEAYVLGMLAAKLVGFQGHKIMSRRSLNHYQKRRPWVAWFEKKLHRFTTYVVGNSLAVMTELNEGENVPKEHLRLIYNGIDSTPFENTRSREEVRKELGIEKNALALIQVANLIPYKGHEDLLKALGQIKARLSQNWRLLCVGKDRNDGFAAMLQQQAETLGLQDNILWLGTRTNVADLLSACDIGILCSHEEGFSNAILEGMAAALPMVVSDVGGNKEAVLDNETGYVVQARHPQALAAAIIDVVENPEKALQFGKQAQLRVKEYFSLETCVSAYEKLYDSLS